MKRLNTENKNEPALFSGEKYIGNLACTDMAREYAMAKYFKEGAYASIGCLNTAIVPLLAERPNTKIYGVDFSEKVLNFLQQRFPKVNYHPHDIRDEIPFVTASLDYIVAGEVIEHLEKPKEFIEECMRALKLGGWLSISTPWEEGVKQGAIDREAHLWSFSTEDIKDFGFTEIELMQEGIQTSIIAWRQKQ